MERLAPCVSCGRPTPKRPRCEYCTRQRPPVACSRCGAPTRRHRIGLCEQCEGYSDPAWRRQWDKIRPIVIAEEPACGICGSPDDPHVDHRDGDVWNLSRRNLRRLCGSCNVKERHRRQRDGQPHHR